MDKWMVAQQQHYIAFIPSKKKPTSGVPVAERSDVCRQLRGAIVHPSQDVRHHAKGCMVRGW